MALDFIGVRTRDRSPEVLQRDAEIRAGADAENELEMQNAGLSTEGWRKKAERQLLIEESTRKHTATMASINKYIATTPALVQNEYNTHQLYYGLKSYLQEVNGRNFADPKFAELEKQLGYTVLNWQWDDILRVGDHLHDEGQLQTHPHIPWTRRSLTEKQLRELPLEGEGSLHELADASLGDQHPAATGRISRDFFVNNFRS